MKPILTALSLTLLACGVTLGQEEPGPSFEHLKAYGPLLGTWRYEGPLLEDVDNFAEKGTAFSLQFAWKRILNKNVIEQTWLAEFEGGKVFSGKALIGWNAAENRIAYGSMDSIGGMSLGSVVFDKDAKSTTSTMRGTDGDGNETSFKGVVIKTGKDTLTWQARERTGGLVDGPSPVYTFKKSARRRKQ